VVTREAKDAVTLGSTMGILIGASGHSRESSATTSSEPAISVNRS
jgi:hypothetical protein